MSMTYMSRPCLKNQAMRSSVRGFFSFCRQKRIKEYRQFSESLGGFQIFPEEIDLKPRMQFSMHKLGMAAHACNPSSSDVQATRPEFQGHPQGVQGQQHETLSQKGKTKKQSFKAPHYKSRLRMSCRFGDNQQPESCLLCQESRTSASSRTSPALPGAVAIKVKDSLPVSMPI